MEKSETPKNSGGKNKRSHAPDFTNPDVNADKTGADNDADKTIKNKKNTKSKLEIDPDTTGIDTKADKTKKEDFPEQPKNK